MNAGVNLHLHDCHTIAIHCISLLFLFMFSCIFTDHFSDHVVQLVGCVCVS